MRVHRDIVQNVTPFLTLGRTFKKSFELATLRQVLIFKIRLKLVEGLIELKLFLNSFRGLKLVKNKAMKSQERAFSRQNFKGQYIENKHGVLYILFCSLDFFINPLSI